MHEAGVNSVPLNPAQAAALAELVELEARWENLLHQPTPKGGSLPRETLVRNQVAHDAFQAKLRAYNRRYTGLVHEALDHQGIQLITLVKNLDGNIPAKTKLAGEHFYRGRPTSYWSREVSRLAFCLRSSRPGPRSGPDRIGRPGCFAESIAGSHRVRLFANGSSLLKLSPTPDDFPKFVKRLLATSSKGHGISADSSRPPQRRCFSSTAMPTACGSSTSRKCFA